MMKIVKSDRNTTTAITSSAVDHSTLSVEVIASLQRMGLSEQAECVAVASGVTAANISNAHEAAGSDVGSSSYSDVIALDMSSVYSDSDLRKLRRVARACIEENKHVKAAKQLLQAISAYKEQQATDDNESEMDADQ